MRPIQNAMSALQKNPRFKELYARVNNNVLKEPHIQQFLDEHRDEINDDMLQKSMAKLYEVSKQTQRCEKCPNLSGCVNLLKGFEPHLFIANRFIDVRYERCPKKKQHDEQQRLHRLVHSMYVPKDVLKATMGDLDLSEDGRIKAISAARRFLSLYTEGQEAKGLFLYGKFGVGKTYLLGALANAMAAKEISSMIVFYPELIRELKSSFADDSVEEKLDVVKNVQVLMLDDIGAESMSSWSRDEVLAPILQYRMLEKLPTFFTSNFDLEGLEKHFTVSQRGEEERMKAARVMERIKYLATPICIEGENKRD